MYILVRMLSYFLIVFYIIIGIWNLVKKNISLFKLNKKEMILNTLFDDFKAIIVIPCLYEQKIILETIDYFNNIINRQNNLELVIVTTEKEEYERTIYKKNFETTSDIINNYFKKNNLKKMKHLHYPKHNGMMSDQLNYVIKFYNETNNDSKKTYFIVYNADSRPNLDTFLNLNKIIYENKFPYIIQQYSYAFLNINKLSFIMKGFAVYQTNFEIKKGLCNAVINNNLFYKYIVGHGLFIRFDLLKRLSGFTSDFWCEDIFLSSNLCNKKIDIIPMTVLENMETPKNLTVLTKQNANWFRTSSQILKIAKANYSIDGKVSFQLILWLINRFILNVSWITFPIVMFIVTFVLMIKNKLILLNIIFLSYIFMEICIFYSTLKIIEKLEKNIIHNKLELLTSFICATCISNIGPLYSLFNFKMKKYKTER